MDEPKEDELFSKMMELVQQKHGDDVDPDFLHTEAERLYLEFGDQLANYFEPMLTEEQKQEFDQLAENGMSQDQAIEFLTRSIDDLEGKMLNALFEFQKRYLNETD